MQDMVVWKDCNSSKEMQMALFKYYDDELDPLRDFMHELNIVPTKVEFQWNKNYEHFETKVGILFEVTEHERLALSLKFS
jgi:hypothetical protein